ncbi:hypothetical protein BDY19DRAFT_963749 [Irpex rosettiformis]|uniref:Uncharacterized protein n=1 Tax=Irpex rosettiformis TaxID=378272 RepID=A0ACB8TVU9_9APHY|nr:hypothetical protein BDY19DRAFT_963749 [Irpex rosettiformis]
MSRQWPQPPKIPTAQEASRSQLPNWMIEPYDYPQPGHSGQLDPWEITEAKSIAEEYRRREERSQRRYGNHVPAHPGAVIPPTIPGGRRLERNPGVTVAPGVDINRIPRPPTMMPPPPHDHPAAEMQRQYFQRDITRIYSPPPTAYHSHVAQPQPQPQAQSSSRQPRRSATHDERKHRAIERATSPRIYSDWPGAADVASSSSNSRARASSQPPQRQRRGTRETAREPASLAEAAEMGMEKRSLKPIHAPYPPDPERTIKLDVGGHGAVCVKRFLEDPAYRSQLKDANKLVRLADNFTWWQVMWPGYTEELYSLNIGTHPTLDKVVESICQSFTRFVNIDQFEHVDKARQPENYAWARLGPGGITTDRIWIGNFGESKRLKRWISYFYVDLPDDPSQLQNHTK